MAATKSLSIRVDDEVKQQSDEVLSTLGLSTSSVVNMLLRTIARNRAVPAELFTTKPLDTHAERNRAYLEKLDRGFEAYRQGLCVRHDLIEDDE
ncbi:type II toxin-antitoxin system RelB/DinJ family antitoxin [uncultured Selenomonas sp.]|jgi:DNA-damage-inducible protein J|uniref:type II toxin-antitoxin system RelB/DinJ family antitoxin n=1 Tax=uncultured Selenomonas sp. TaxID=159275 RepID=UPI0025DD59BA|nr:type II toxin-antitoxin system RelB/DinJ family antitoxin [uncultured Selenomonas sp.]